MKTKIILILVISSLIIGCVGNNNTNSFTNQKTSTKNIIPETISDISQRIFEDCGTTIQCENWIETHINGKYVRWNGTVSDAKDNVLVVSVGQNNLKRSDGMQDYMPPYVTVYLYDLSKNELLKFKNGDKVQFIGKINIKKSSPPYHNEYSSVWASMVGVSPFGEKLELYDVTIEQIDVVNSTAPITTENPCLISENPPYPNGWTKEQVKEFNERIKDQPCQKLGS